MAKTVRLHTLAKELGIPSKIILDKCKAEGIDLKNHMAAISLGLAESIKEWFSVGADVTSVEEAAPVDLAALPKRRARTHAAGESANGHGSDRDHEGGIAVEEGDAGQEPEDSERKPAADESIVEPPPSRPVTERPVEAPVSKPAAAAPPAPPVAPAVEPAAEPAILSPNVEQAEPPAEIAAVAPSASTPVAKPAEPIIPAPPPESVQPAGPQVVPRPAELRGPRLVRMEAPEPVAPPRPRSSWSGPAGPPGATRRPGTPPPPPGPVGSPPPRGRGGRPQTEEEREAARRGTRSPRRHGNLSDVVERMREWRDQDLLERKERLASATGHGLRDRRAAEKRRQTTSAPAAAPGARKGDIEITAPITIKEFCAKVGRPFNQVFAKLMEQTGKPMAINQQIDAETVELLSIEFGVPVTITRAKTALETIEDEFEQRERKHLRPRPPVVAMLGHVDHGKTSLLDAIRRTNVAAKEAGGITQTIGAYRVDRGDWHVTFIDTPGHEAFTAMRARGANLTDVVVLVVAADDGVMPQTVEAINHAKAAGVTIVVALNKIDLPGVDLNKVYGQLSEHELVPTEWGGTTDVVKTSATANIGIDDLIAHLSTLSDLLDLKADPDVPAHAVVIDAQMREGQGVVAQVLVREGTLRAGQIVVCGPGAGRIRALIDDKGRRLKDAGPGTPVEVLGLETVPGTGDRLYAIDDLARAKEIAAEAAHVRREASLRAVGKPRTLEALFAGDDSEEAELAIILKADKQGSLDALLPKLEEFSSIEGVQLRLLHSGVGAITEADVRLAQASEGILIGFTVIAEERARQLADQVGVEIRAYRVIYDLLEDLRKALHGLLEPEERMETRGRVEVRQIFHVSRVGTIAGCQVLDGTIARSHKVRLVRDGRVVLESGSIESLKRFKDDAREVRAGLECGVKIANFDDVKPADIIEAYEIVEVARS
ncbi:MAG: translation initiation factor IF-2 [Phycisphaerae bacterium]